VAAQTGLGRAVERKLLAEAERLGVIILEGVIEPDDYKVQCAARNAFLKAITLLEDAEAEAAGDTNRRG